MAQTRNSSKRRKKKKQQRNLLFDWMLYALMRLVVAIASLLPIHLILKLACLFGRLLWKYHAKGRQRALDNLRASFPDKDEDWIVQTGQRSFEHIAMLGVDVMLMPRLARKTNWQDYSCYRHVEQVKWLMQEGKGLLLVTGHYSNFEIMGYILGLFGFPIYSVARPLDNRFVDRYIRSIRERKGQKIIDKKGASLLMSQVSSSGAALGLIADQDAGKKKGIFVDFFGRPASTFKSIALLALTRDIPIAVGYSRRQGNRFFFEIGVKRIIFPHEWADKQDPVTWITSEYTQAIEAFVREDPTQYWWVHRRWKSRPKVKNKGT
jgi:KDO2-lipid IV(A) lauroyltransferase